MRPAAAPFTRPTVTARNLIEWARLPYDLLPPAQIVAPNPDTDHGGLIWLRNGLLLYLPTLIAATIPPPDALDLAWSSDEAAWFVAGARVPDSFIRDKIGETLDTVLRVLDDSTSYDTRTPEVGLTARWLAAARVLFLPDPTAPSWRPGTDWQAYRWLDSLKRHRPADDGPLVGAALACEWFLGYCKSQAHGYGSRIAPSVVRVAYASAGRPGGLLSASGPRSTTTVGSLAHALYESSLIRPVATATGRRLLEVL